MKNQKRFYWNCCLALLMLVFSAGIAQAKTTVDVVTDRADAIYEKGTPIQFIVKVLSDENPAAGNIEYSLSNDRITPLKQGKIALQNGEARIEWKQDTPMIVRCAVTYSTGGKKPISGAATAAVAPYEIQPTATEPADFMEYWNAQKAELAKIPINAQLEPIDVKDDNIEIFDVSLANIDGSHVRAYFGKPKGNGPFPALLYIPGASVSSASVGYVKGWAAEGFLVIALSVHDLPNGQSKEFYDKQRAGALKTYYKQGRKNRDTYYYRRVILGNIRAIDYLTSRPEWDHRHMIVNGSSQGGGMTLMTTGLDSRVTAAASNVPALSDHSGRNFGRPSGWPQLAVEKDNKLNPQILETSRYYDAVNFARYIKVPMIFGVGLLDNTCPPTTVFSAYNTVKSDKKIDIAPLMGHSYSPSYRKMLSDFIVDQAKK